MAWSCTSASLDLKLDYIQDFALKLDHVQEIVQDFALKLDHVQEIIQEIWWKLDVPKNSDRMLRCSQDLGSKLGHLRDLGTFELSYSPF